jgi:dCMP deaminase
MNIWDERFLKMAELVASWSKDPSTQTGAVIVDKDNRVVSVGYNGFPKGVEDTEERLNNRELKYKMIVHCERNAMLFAQRNLEGCKLYTWPFMSCAPCAAQVINAGIKEVIAPKSDNPRWKADFDLSTQLFEEAGVKVTLV